MADADTEDFFRKMPDGTLVAHAFEDMFPFLPKEEVENNMMLKGSCCNYFIVKETKMLENNKILNLREKYQNGKLEKHQYITEMYQFHKILLEYIRIVQKTDIRDIVINKHGMFITTDTGLVLKAYEAERAIPFEMLNFGNY